ncbi:MAG TPA: winged helix DNA-binding domain-containing protein [Gaiellaceae bacterium]
MHAQVQASAELQLAARVEGITQQDVRDALWRDRRLVRAWTLRGTLHLHPAGELALWFAARQAVSGGSSEGLEAWPDPKGAVHPPVSADELTAIRAAVWDALDGRALLRQELAAEVVRRVGRKHEARLLAGFAFFTGALCQGPPQGNKVTFVRPDQWVDGWAEVDEQEALREVCSRFLYTYGPARPTDFRAWFGPAQFESLDLDEVDVEGRRAYILAGDMDFPEPQSSVRLLPEYDVYVMGFREREHLVPDAVRAQVAGHGRGRYEGPAGVRFLLVDGVTAGLWERKRRGKRIELQVNPVRKLTRARRAELDAEAERIGAFLGLEPVLTVE